MYHKWQSYDAWFLRYQAQQTEFFVILGYFWPVYPLTIQKIKILKYYLKYYHFTHEHHKSKSYDLWFLRYGVRQTESFLISDHFLLFYPLPPPPQLNNPKNQNFEKMKKHLWDIMYHKWQPYDIGLLRYQLQQIFLSSWAIFCLFTPPPLITPKMKI